MIKANSEYMRNAVLKSIDLFSIFGWERSSPNIYSGHGHHVFPHAMNSFGLEMCSYIYHKWAVFFSASLLQHTDSRTRTIMAFYSGSVSANCCVWLTSQSLSRQVAGYVLFSCKSKEHKVLETGNFPDRAACRSQRTTKALLLVRRERGGGEGEIGEWKKTN